jgi:hypothetical protein
MRLLVVVSLLFLAGCAGTTGPRRRDQSLQNVAPTGLPIPEQEARAKMYLPYPFTKPMNGPRTYMEIPEEQYGQRSH